MKIFSSTLVLLSLTLSFVSCNNDFKLCEEGKDCEGTGNESSSPAPVELSCSSYELSSTQIEQISNLLGANLGSADLTDLDASGKNLGRVDFSNTTGLTVGMLNQASAINGWGTSNCTSCSHYYTVLPAMDVTGLNTNRNLSVMDFSNVTGLTVSMLNTALSTSATNLRFVKLPAMDLTGLNTTGMNLNGIDFSLVTGLTVTMLNNSSSFNGAVLPAMDITGLTTSKSWDYIDFSNVTAGMNVSLLNTHSGDYIKLPAIDLTGIDATILGRMDLSLTTGLTVSMINTAAGVSPYLEHTTLPAINMTGVNFQGESLRYADLSQVTGLTASHLATIGNYFGLELPAMDVTGFNTTGLSFRGVDFSHVTGLTVAMLDAASDISGDTSNTHPRTKLPAIDISTLNTAGRNLNKVDFTLTTGLTSAMLDASSSYQYAILPAIDISGLTATGRNFSGTDFSNTTGFDPQFLKDASDISGSWTTGRTVLPAIDLSSFDPTGVSFQSIDLSNTTGIDESFILNMNSSGFNSAILPSFCKDNIDFTGFNFFHSTP